MNIGYNDSYYFDVPQCIVDSLNEGVTDYAYTKDHAFRAILRYRKDGRKNALVVPIKNEEGKVEYYQFLPVEINMKHTPESEAKPVKRFAIPLHKLLPQMQVIYKDGKTQQERIIKDFYEEVRERFLNESIEIANKRNL